MSTTELALEKPAQDSVVITTTPDRIAELKTKFSALKLDGVELVDGKVVVKDASAMVADKENLKALKDFRMKEVVKQRTACDREFKAMKDPAWEECKRWDKWHNDFLALIAVIEKPCIAIEEAYEAELDRLAQVAADKKWEYRLAQLFVAGVITGSINEESIRRMDEDAFMREIERVVADKKRRDEAEAEAIRLKEQQRLDAEKLAEERRLFEAQKLEMERIQQVERDRLAKDAAEAARLQKIENDRIAAEQAELSKKLKAEQDRLDKLRKEQEDLLRVQQQKLEADRLAEANRIAAKELDLKRQQDAIDERNRQQQAEEDRIEQLRAQAEADQREREEMAARPVADESASHYQPYEKGAWARAMEMEDLPQPEADAFVPEVAESLPWKMIAAREVCEFLNDQCGLPFVTDTEIEQVADLIISVYSTNR